jgi:hypothetical protein
VSDARAIAGVVERAVAAVVEQPMAGALRDGRVGQRPAVHQEDVRPAVVVVVEEQSARAHGLDEVLVWAGAVDVREGDAGVARDVDETAAPESPPQ